MARTAGLIFCKGSGAGGRGPGSPLAACLLLSLLTGFYPRYAINISLLTGPWPPAPGLRPDKHGALVRRQPFAIGHRGDGVGVASNRLARVMNHRLALEKIIDAERRREARRADRRQHMIRAGKVIADGLARIGAEKDGAGVFDHLRRGFIVSRHQLKMLRRDAVR